MSGLLQGERIIDLKPVPFRRLRVICDEGRTPKNYGGDKGEADNEGQYERSCSEVRT